MTYIAAILLAGILMKQLSYISKLKIKTRKCALEIGLFAGGIVGIILLSVAFAREPVHYLIAVLGMILLIVDWMKQGISDAGITLIARGKEYYSWSDIGEVRTSLSDKVSIDYYSNTKAKIITHNYSITDYERIIKILNDNEVPNRICQSTK